MSSPETSPAEWHPRASIVLATHNGVASTVRCLEALSANTPGDLYEVIVVDNGSVDGTPDLLRSLGGDVRVVLNDDNRGFIRAANQGAALATGDYIVLLGSDTEPGPGWLEVLLDLADADATVGVAGARLMSSWGTVRECGAVVREDGAIERLGSGAHPRDPRFSFVRPVDLVPCAAMLVRRDLWTAVGGLDETLSPVFYEDAALCFSAWARGLRVVVHTGSSVVQHDTTADGMEWLARYEPISRDRFMETWGDEVRRLADEDRPGPDWDLMRRSGARVLVIDPLPADFDRAAGGQRLINTVMRLHARGCYVRLSTRWDESMSETVEALRLLGVDVRIDGNAAAAMARRAWDEVVVFLYDLCDTAFDTIRDSAPGLPVAIDLAGRHFVPEPAELSMQPAHPLWEAVTDDRRARVTKRLTEALADGSRPLKLNLGCGPKPLPGYFNIDVVPLPGVDMAADVVALPQFPDGCADEIRMDAVFEHIYRHERPAALAEWRRILKPGGRLAINWIPDFDALVDAYRACKPGFIHDEFDLFEMWRFVHGGYTATDVPYQIHKDLFTVGSVERELRDAGFDVEFVQPARFEGEHLVVNINAVGVKPRVARLAQPSRSLVAGTPAARVVRRSAECAPRLSVVINTLNEEANIEGCLESVAPIADEIVLVDMHSDDRTVEIARRYTDRVFLHERVGIVEPARNFAVGKATGDWILILDADERLTPALRDGIRDLIAHPDGVDVFEIPFNTCIAGRWMEGTGWGRDHEWHPRLFRTGAVRWSTTVHGSPQYRGRQARLPLPPEAAIDHYNHRDLRTFIDKVNRYTDDEARALQAGGERWSVREMLAAARREIAERYEPEKDGAHSLVLANLMAFYRFASWAKLWEREGYPQDELPATADELLEMLTGREPAVAVRR